MLKYGCAIDPSEDDESDSETESITDELPPMDGPDNCGEGVFYGPEPWRSESQKSDTATTPIIEYAEFIRRKRELGELETVPTRADVEREDNEDRVPETARGDGGGSSGSGFDVNFFIAEVVNESSAETQ